MVVARTQGTMIGGAVRTFVRFLTDGGRLLWRHWPGLVALFLIGWIGRMGFLWLATVVSDWSPTLAVLVLPLAPLSTLLSFVLMMRVMTPSLPAFEGMITASSRRQRWNEDLTVAGQVMIPFLAVYASAGLLKQDASVFLLDSTADESLNTVIQDIDWGRADYAPGLAIVAFILIALVARKVISMLDLVKRHLAWAGLAAYIEVLWIMTLANALSTELESITRWVTSRRLIASTIDWWERFSAAVREWSALLGGIIDAVSAVLGNLGSVVAIPVAWLAIGAAIYGHQLQASRLAVPGHEEMSRRIKRVPNPVRRAALQISEPVVTPIQSAVKAIQKVAVAGILPMVMFCVVFLVAGAVQSGVAAVVRAAIGPGTGLRQFALEPYATMLERGAYFVIVLALLAAAVNVVVLAQRARAEAEAAQAEAEAEAAMAEVEAMAAAEGEGGASERPTA